MTDESVSLARDSDSVSSSVLEKAVRGDQLAFTQITEIYSRLVYYWCRKNGVSDFDAFDVAQQVFIAVSRNLPAFRRDSPHQSFRAWIRAVTRSKIADYWRELEQRETAEGGSDALRRLETMAAPQEDEDVQELRWELTELFRQAVKFMQHEFSDRDFQAFWTATVDGCPAREVAERYGMTPNSVFIVISRMKKRVRAEFGDLIDYGADEAT